MSWVKGDLTNYNHAHSPWYKVYDNGKVDINNELGGSEGRISLQPWGMYKLVHEWLESGHGLSNEEKNKLIKLLK